MDILEELLEMVDALGEDVRESASLSRINDSQFTRRIYIRSVFALIEGNIFQMKRVIIDAYDKGKIKLTSAEEAIVKEETCDLSKGKPRVQTKFLPILENVRFTIPCFARAFGGNYEPEYSNQGWQYFQKAIKICNRITHPKEKKELIISDDEITCIEKARDWFNNTIEEMLKVC
jgi:hypothetical protein